MNYVSFVLGAAYSLVLLISLLEAPSFKRRRRSMHEAYIDSLSSVHSRSNLGGCAAPWESVQFIIGSLCSGERKQGSEGGRGRR